MSSPSLRATGFTKSFLIPLLIAQIAVGPFSRSTHAQDTGGGGGGGSGLDPETELALRSACAEQSRWVRVEDFVRAQIPDVTSEKLAEIYGETGWRADDILTIVDAPPEPGQTKPQLIPVDCTQLGFTGDIHQGHLNEGDGPCVHALAAGTDVLGAVPGQNLTDAGEAAGEAPQCKNPPDFKKDLACEAARSFLQVGTLGIGNAIASAWSDGAAQCAGLTTPTCLSSIISGIIDDLWSNVTGLWEVGKGIVSYGYDTIAGWFSSEPAQAIEDHAGDAALAAARADDSMLDQFLSDPKAFISNMISELWKSFTGYIEENFMCAKWSGVPHYSTCEKPMESWRCAPWGTTMHAVCGLAGILGGEALVFWLTAGAGSLVVKGAKSAQVAAWGARLAEATIGVERATRVVEVGGNVLSKVGRGAEATADVLSHGGSAQRLAQSGKLVQWSATLATLPTRVPMAILRKIAGLPGIRHYLEFLGRAAEDGAMRGSRLADRLFTPAAKTTQVAAGTTETALVAIQRTEGALVPIQRSEGAAADAAAASRAGSAADAGATTGRTSRARPRVSEGFDEVSARALGSDDPYEILGISRGASEAEIKEAFKRARLSIGEPEAAGLSAERAATARQAQRKVNDAYEKLRSLSASRGTSTHAAGAGAGTRPGNAAPAAAVDPLEAEAAALARSQQLRKTGARGTAALALAKVARTDTHCFPHWNKEKEEYDPLPADCQQQQLAEAETAGDLGLQDQTGAATGPSDSSSATAPDAGSGPGAGSGGGHRGGRSGSGGSGGGGGAGPGVAPDAPALAAPGLGLGNEPLPDPVPAPAPLPEERGQGGRRPDPATLPPPEAPAPFSTRDEDSRGDGGTNDARSNGGDRDSKSQPPRERTQRQAQARGKSELRRQQSQARRKERQAERKGDSAELVAQREALVDAAADYLVLSGLPFERDSEGSSFITLHPAPEEPASKTALSRFIADAESLGKKVVYDPARTSSNRGRTVEENGVIYLGDADLRKLAPQWGTSQSLVREKQRQKRKQQKQSAPPEDVVAPPNPGETATTVTTGSSSSGGTGDATRGSSSSGAAEPNSSGKGRSSSSDDEKKGLFDFLKPDPQRVHERKQKQQKRQEERRRRQEERRRPKENADPAADAASSYGSGASYEGM